MDQRIVDLLTAQSDLIVVGQVIRQNLVNSRYGMLRLNAEYPFEIKSLKILKGNGAEGGVLKAGVTREDSLFFTVETNYLFFLKADPQKGKFSPEPLATPEWRAVSDHFGVQLYTPALEQMVSILEMKLVSCQTRQRQIAYSFVSAYQPQHAGEIPYQPGVAGHVMLARQTAIQPGALNCNHGVPENRFGGWQAVNLSPREWLALRQAWTKRYRDNEIPFFWCGKNTGLDRRVVVSVRWAATSEGERWVFEHSVIQEHTLRVLVDHLRQCLTDIGAKPIDIDVPESVDWIILISPSRPNQ